MRKRKRGSLRGCAPDRTFSEELLNKMGRRLGGDGVILAADDNVERKLLNTSGAVVVKFWDGKAHLAEEAFSRVARRMGGDLKFVCVQMRNGALKDWYELKHSPTFIFFENGREKSRIEGSSPSEALEVWCELNSS